MTMSDSNKSSGSDDEDDAAASNPHVEPSISGDSPKIHRATLNLTTAEAQKFISEQLQRHVEVTITTALEKALSQMESRRTLQREEVSAGGVTSDKHGDTIQNARCSRSHSTPAPVKRPQISSTGTVESSSGGSDDEGTDDQEGGGKSSCPSAKEPIALVLLSAQISLIVMFGFLVKYDEGEEHHYGNNETTTTTTTETTTGPPSTFKQNSTRMPNMVSQYYQQYQDIQVMVFLGIGVLMAFIRKYGYSAIGFTMLAGALAVQWSILVRGLIFNGPNPIPLNIVSLIYGDFAAAVVLISYGVVIGVASPLQLVFMTFAEILFYIVNKYIGAMIFQAVDTGGSIFVHVFAAYFGLGVSRGMRSVADINTTHLEPSYNSNIFCLVAVVFLWLFWPSFNSALSTGMDQDRVVINTMLSLFGSCVTAFATSALFNGNKFVLAHVQNASLAGGVAVGAVVDLMILPCGALTIGVLGGFLCVFGCQFISPLLSRKLGLHDSCGVHNLHGLPGVLAALASVLLAALASECDYGPNLYLRYPARAPLAMSPRLAELQALSPNIAAGVNRTGMGQAMVQLTVLGITLGVSIVAGAFTGLLMRLPIFRKMPRSQCFLDGVYFEMEPEEVTLVKREKKTIDQKLSNKVIPKNSINPVPAFVNGRDGTTTNASPPPDRRKFKKYEL
ncbi:ammonium transporter Rh type A-like [Folsomia candida]|uniref:ammonium transporter Rh type A-like n=1 Tax=Folsomia candida TaxID=158441 RepID=UPI0016050434|nr:ammonium transporter Rh type A-like [Folsomia candida]